jgi:SNF2 family DNA or RNA helicase
VSHDAFDIALKSPPSVDVWPKELTILHDYQKEAVTHAVTRKRWVFNDEMGLGKTPQAIATCRLLKANKILIVCPAVVRQNWLRELSKWWPDHPAAGSVLYGPSRVSFPSKKEQARHAEALGSPIQVVSPSTQKPNEQTI